MKKLRPVYSASNVLMILRLGSETYTRILRRKLKHPCAGKTLKDELEGLRSFRVSRFRIVYRIASEKSIIEIVAIGLRERIYEETLRLVRKEGR